MSLWAHVTATKRRPDLGRRAHGAPSGHAGVGTPGDIVMASGHDVHAGSRVRRQRRLGGANPEPLRRKVVEGFLIL